jgi:alkyl hydroperoxide reductase subunit F
MLTPEIRSQLAAHVDKIRHPVILAPSLDDSPTSSDLAQLLDEIAALSDLITVDRRDDGDRRPSFVIERAGTDVAVEFAGIPLGHELTSLVLALLQVGGHPPRVDDDIAEQIRDLDGDYLFETYLSLSCQNCPEVVQALNTMTVLNPSIRHIAIDGGVFRDEVEERNVLAVPQVFLNGEPFESGRVGIEQILAKLDTSSQTRQASRINEKEPFDVLVVGGGPAGAASSVYTARKGVRTGVVTDRFGGQVLDTLGIENFISVPRTEGPKLASALEEHVKSYDVDVMVPLRASALVPAAEAGGLHTIELDNGATLQARTIVVSTGARWRHLGVPGESEYLNKGVAFCPHCDGPLFAGKRIAVIGGGNSGVEAAIDLAGVTDHVTLIEFQSQLLADDVLQAKLRSLDNVHIIVDAATTEILGDGRTMTGLRYRNRVDDSEHQLDLAGVFVQIGLLPNTEWLDGVVALTDRGEIMVDDRGLTSVPGVFAAGDCTTEPYKQIVIAMGGGATAGLSAFDHLVRTSAPAPDQAPIPDSGSELAAI